MALSLKKLIHSLEKKEMYKNLVLHGENTFIFSEMKKLVESQGFSLKRFSINKQGPGADVEAEAMGLGLFGEGTLLWLKSSHSPDQWSGEGKKLYHRILDACDAQTLSMILELPGSDKKNVVLYQESENNSVRMDINDEDLSFWIERINKSLPQPLSSDRCDFLLHFDSDLLMYSQWMELWSLGGDLWASQALGWEKNSSLEVDKNFNSKQPPAFAFIDAILLKHKKEALHFLDRLYEQQQDPLQLLGLISRNARMLSVVQRGDMPEKTPSFVVQKLKRSKVPAWRWLEECAQIDNLLKSSSVDSKALYAKMLNKIL
jgi:DNA polymerase III delta subunit